jgi:hypothetical protein
MGYEPLLIGVIAFALAALGWSGFQGLRAGRHFRRSLPVDVSHLSLAPPPQVRRVIDQLQRAGFSRLGEDRSARPDLKRQITTWILTDRDGTTAAEVGASPGAGEAICGFITLFSDGALLVTGHSFGEPHRAEGFVMQAAPASPEDAWQRHQKAQKEMAPRHGGALRLRSISDLLAHSATIRARLMDHHPRRNLWMMAGWIAGALIVWAAIAITGLASFRSGITKGAVGDWLAGLRWPVLAAGLPTMLCCLFRLTGPAPFRTGR